MVYGPKTGVLAFAVTGDCCGLGEGSVKLHLDLGNEPVITRNGVQLARRDIEDLVLTVVFPGVNAAASLDGLEWNKSIQAKGSSALEAWGGRKRLEVCSQ